MGCRVMNHSNSSLRSIRDNMLGEILGFIINFIRRRRLIGRVRRRVEDIEHGNEIQKAVGEYQDAPIGLGNVVVSGNNNSIRNRVACAMAHNAYEHGRPVIVLHCGNKDLEEMLDTAFSGESGFHCVNTRNPIYDPFDGLPKEEISQLVLNSSGTSNKVDRSGGVYINGLTDYLTTRGRRTLTRTYIECPHDQIFNRVKQEQAAGHISAEDATYIVSQLTQGKMEQGAVEQYFRNLNLQASCILASKSNVDRATSIKKTIAEKDVIIIDLISASNNLLISVVLQELRNAMAEGREYTLVLDSIPVDSSESLGQLLRNYSNACNFVYSSSDVYAETQSTEALFNTIMARANNVFVMQHNSAETNRRFSENFGHYRKIEITRTFTTGDSYGRYTQILPGQNINEILNPQPVDRPRVEEQEIASLGVNDVYIRRDRINEIARVRCIDGSVTATYPEPQRKHVLRTRVRRINWLVFWLLFVFCYPAAFIYSFVMSGWRGKIVSGIFLALFVMYLVSMISLMGR